MKNFLVLTGGEVVCKLLTVAAIVYVARVVGPAGFGYLEFAMSVALLAGLLVHQGFGLYGAREIARDPTRTDRLVAEIVSIRFALAILAYAGLLLFVYFTDRPAVAEQLVLLYGLSLLLMPLGLQWVFQGHEQMQTVAALQVARQTVFMVVVFALLRGSVQLWPVAIAEIAGVATVAVGSIWLYRRQFGKHVPLLAPFSRGLMCEGAVIGMSRLFWSARIFGSIVIVGLIATEQEIGFFGAAMRVLIGLHVFVWLYFINLLPSLSRAWVKEGSIQSQIARSMHIVCWLSLGAGVLWVMLAPVAIQLVYGSAFTPAAPVLQWLGVVCVVASIHGHYRFGLIAANRQKEEMMTSALGTLISLSLIPVGYMTLGVTGAALALVAGEIIVWFSSWLFSRRRLQLGGEMRFLVRPVICIAFLFALFQILPNQFPLAAQVAIAVIVFGGAAYVSDAVVRQSSKQVISLWQARLWKQRGDLQPVRIDEDRVDPGNQA